MPLKWPNKGQTKAGRKNEESQARGLTCCDTQRILFGVSGSISNGGKVSQIKMVCLESLQSNDVVVKLLPSFFMH